MNETLAMPAQPPEAGSVQVFRQGERGECLSQVGFFVWTSLPKNVHTFSQKRAATCGK